MHYLSLLKEVPLFWWHAWTVILIPLAASLGAVGIFFALCAGIVRLVEEYRASHSFREALNRSRQYFRDTVATPAKGFLVLFVIGGFALGPYKLNQQDQSQLKIISEKNKALANANNDLDQRYTNLQTRFELKRHSIDTTDPVFPNIIYLLQAFDIYRHARNGTPCVVMVTATPDSAPLASVVAQFSNSVSDCYTFGPMVGNLDPDVEKQTTTGMVPNMIVFHQDRDDKAAGQLVNSLGNYLQLKVSYELPTKRNYSVPEKGKEKLVWLQFGTGVKWNSELH
jgi:hypothetical protein